MPYNETCKSDLMNNALRPRKITFTEDIPHRTTDSAPLHVDTALLLVVARRG